MTPMTTREGLPEVWGVSEILEFANEQLAQVDKPPLNKVTVAGWCRLAGFPQPAFDLRMGTGWIADEVRPWVLNRLARPGMRSGRKGNALPPETRAAIAATRGTGRRLTQVAADFGVGQNTVARIWAQVREERPVG